MTYWHCLSLSGCLTTSIQDCKFNEWLHSNAKQHFLLPLYISHGDCWSVAGGVGRSEDVGTLRYNKWWAAPAQDIGAPHHTASSVLTCYWASCISTYSRVYSLLYNGHYLERRKLCLIEFLKVATKIVSKYIKSFRKKSKANGSWKKHTIIIMFFVKSFIIISSPKGYFIQILDFYCLKIKRYWPAAWGNYFL